MKRIIYSLFVIVCPFFAVSQTNQKVTYCSYYGNFLGGYQQLRAVTKIDDWVIESDLQLTTPYYPPISQKIRFGLDSKKVFYQFDGNEYPWLQLNRDTVRRTELLWRNKIPAVSVSSVASLTGLIKCWEKKKKPLRLTDSENQSLQIIQKNNVQVGDRKLDLYLINGLSWGWAAVWKHKDSVLPVAVVSPLLATTVLHIENNSSNLLSSFWDSYFHEVISYIRSAYLKKTIFPNRSKLLLIKSIRYWNGVDSVFSKPCNILIDNGKIRLISFDEIKAEQNMTIIEGEGKFMIPGLRDQHAHIKQPEWLVAYLGTGITGFRDLGNDSLIINAMQRDLNFDSFMWPEFKKFGIINGKSNPSRFAEAIDTSEARNLMSYYQQHHYDGIKVWNQLSQTVFDFVVKHASEYGFKVSGHIPHSVSLPYALAAGLSEVNHLSSLTNYFEVNPESYDSILNLMKQKNTKLDPTLVVAEVQTRLRSYPVHKMEPALKGAPPAIIRLMSIFGMPDSVASQGTKYMQFQKQLLMDAYARGIKITAGSDQGVPGFTLLREIELYVSSGIPAYAALQTAINPGSDGNQLHVGSTINGVIYDQNPFSNISSVRKPLFVLKEKYFYDAFLLRQLAGYEF